MTGLLRDRPAIRAGQPGLTLVELLVAMVVSVILIAAGVSLFTTFQKNVVQQRVVRQTQTQTHRSVEQIVRLVRNSTEIDPTSTQYSLGVTSTLAPALCGTPTCWVEATVDGRLIARPPTGSIGTGHEMELASSVDSVNFRYGIFDNNGKLEEFRTQVPGGRAADALAVRVHLFLRATEAQNQSVGTLKIHAVQRTGLLSRLSL